MPITAAMIELGRPQPPRRIWAQPRSSALELGSIMASRADFAGQTSCTRRSCIAVSPRALYPRRWHAGVEISKPIVRGGRSSVIPQEAIHVRAPGSRRGFFCAGGCSAGVIAADQPLNRVGHRRDGGLREVTGFERGR